MENKNFEEAERIREQYVEKKTNKIDELRALDNKVRTPAQIAAYTLGIAGTLILGVGMCLAMKVIFNLMYLGVIVGIIGIAIISANYFIYKTILNKRKKKYAGRIMQLSDEILRT